MKGWKKILALGCCTGMVFSMAGCQSSEKMEETKAKESANEKESQASAVEDNKDSTGKKYKVAWASLCEDNDFGVASRESFEREAAKMGWETVILNNNYDGPTAIQNGDTVITQKVDGFINFQVDAGVAPTVAQMMKDADIPMITVDCPHPDTPFFGANNEEAGLIVGRALADKAQKDWNGEADMVVLCGAPGSGEVVDLRMQNIAKGVKETLKKEDIQVVDLDGKSEIETSQKVVADILTANPDKKHILIGCLNDQSALGAFNAVEAAGRQGDVFIASHGCDAPAINNLKNNDANCWIGSVAYFPERYGTYVVPLMQKLLEGEEIPELSYPEHVFVDKNNVLEYYPD